MAAGPVSPEFLSQRHRPAPWSRLWLGLLIASALLGASGVGAQARSGPEVETVILPAAVVAGAPLGLQFVGHGVGYALLPLATGGLLARTEDAGRSWQEIPLPRGLNYSGLIFFGAQRGVVLAQTLACGAVRPGCEAQVLYTHDGGRSFRATLRAKGSAFGVHVVFRGNSAWLELYRIDNAALYGRGPETLYGTAQGGRTWHRIAGGSAFPMFAVVSTIDGRAGYALAGGHLLRTVDGGQSWQALASLPADVNRPISAVSGSIAALPGGVVYLTACDGGAGNGGCENYLYRSVDGGRTVVRLWNQYCTIRTFVHMRTALEGALILAGSAGGCGPGKVPPSNVVYNTTNGFQSRQFTYAFPFTVSALEFTNTLDGWAAGSPQLCGDPPGCGFAVARTKDGGKSWSSVYPLPVPTGPIAGVPGGPYFGIGSPTDASAVYRSVDGRVWQLVGHLPPAINPTALGSGDLQFPTARTGYIAYGSGIARSMDGGRSFTALRLPGGGSVAAISFLTAQLGYVLMNTRGGSSELLRTTDGGRKFTVVHRFPSAQQIASVAFVSAKVGYALGTEPTTCGTISCTSGPDLLETTDGGRSFFGVRQRLQASGAPVTLYPGFAGTVVEAYPGGFALLGRDARWRIVRLRLPSAASPFLLQYGSPVDAVAAGQRVLLSLPGHALVTGVLGVKTWSVVP